MNARHWRNRPQPNVLLWVLTVQAFAWAVFFVWWLTS
jgi:hypothetical protein